MGWNSHPDTLSIAAATGAANRTGHPQGSIEWRKAYRDAYYEQNKGEPYGTSLQEYIDGLDAAISSDSR